MISSCLLRSVVRNKESSRTIQVSMAEILFLYGITEFPRTVFPLLITFSNVGILRKFLKSASSISPLKMINLFSAIFLVQLSLIYANNTHPD